MPRRLSEFFTPPVAQKSGYIRGIHQELDPLITGMEYDSRRIKPGNLYFALPGLHADGHSFIPGALQQGAAAIIHQDELGAYRDGVVYIRVRDSRFAMAAAADAFYGFPSEHLVVAGVTGTEGKSTTVYLIYQLLRLAGKPAGFISTVQYDKGEGEVKNPEHQTTPEATAIHRFLREMLDRGVEYAVLEASSHGLSPRTNRLGEIAFDAGVMTNVTHEHLEFHGTWEQYREDKANLFRALDRVDHVKAIGPSGKGAQRTVPAFGVANADDPSGTYFSAATRCRTFTFSVRGFPADLGIRSLKSEGSGNRYEVHAAESGEQILIQDRLPGAFNAGNVLGALLTVSGLLSIPVRDLVPLVPSLKPVRGRMTTVDQGQPFEVLVDYAHTPSSFETIFPPLRERMNRSGGRIISLFGSAGERDTQKRPLQGRIASQWSDILILTDEDPRRESPMVILEEIAAGCPGRGQGEDLFLIPDRPAAIRKALSLARPGDLLLLLGKGHENSIIYGDTAMDYDEIGEAEKALAERGYGGKGNLTTT
ncbi:MAG: UDP-N-acetylmuramoyl-L-alanyl-D-glutamate--2,6-diaminopimelate ligase [Spirochaetaceae bacterium]|jgi:UDP-N-acetylmuramoyl-L-alanyl-D-glutamate--2,6-diaminopimelate ligase|nr:UDP-N-acetylmuramoyl-L-alanyl-D-glutamate--2,6-diaminopimelate ligase [Spirochaetaceae bacterium]